MGLTYAQLEDTPFGPLSFMAGDHGLQGVAYSSLELFKQNRSWPDNTPSLKGLETLGTLLVEINAYLFGIQRVFTVDIDWGVMDSFQREVLMLISEIPYGEVSTYGKIAEQLGKPGAARAVGSVLRHNPMPIVIPCHRVIGSDHTLHGYLGGREIKTFLLELEGHRIIKNKLVPR